MDASNIWVFATSRMLRKVSRLWFNMGSDSAVRTFHSFIIVEAERIWQGNQHLNSQVSEAFSTRQSPVIWTSPFSTKWRAQWSGKIIFRIGLMTYPEAYNAVLMRHRRAVPSIYRKLNNAGILQPDSVFLTPWSNVKRTVSAIDLFRLKSSYLAPSIRADRMLRYKIWALPYTKGRCFFIADQASICQAMPNIVASVWWLILKVNWEEPFILCICTKWNVRP